MDLVLGEENGITGRGRDGANPVEGVSCPGLGEGLGDDTHQGQGTDRKPNAAGQILDNHPRLDGHSFDFIQVLQFQED